jgi:hypothetical protein
MQVSFGNRKIATTQSLKFLGLSSLPWLGRITLVTNF